MVRTLISALASLAAATWALTSAGAARAECKIVQVGQFPVVMTHQRILVPSEVNGQKVYFIFDTGGQSLLFPEAVDRLGISTHNITTAALGMQIYGVGGQIQPRVAEFKSLKLGGLDMSRGEMMVGDSRHSEPSQIVGTIGYDIFARHDIEFDLANKVIRLLKTSGCSDDQMDYWRAPYAVATLKSRGGLDNHSYVEVRLNDAPVEAILDTGSPVSTVTLAGAQRAGVRPSSPGVREVGVIGGLGAHTTPLWIAPFNSFSIGEEKIANPHLAMADMFHNDLAMVTGSNVPQAIDMPGMLVGLDFFMAHRVLISRDHQKVYFSYNGGPIFEPPHIREGAAAPNAAPGASTAPASGH